jgi:amidase
VVHDAEALVALPLTRRMVGVAVGAVVAATLSVAGYTPANASSATAAEDATRAAIARIEKLDPTLHAVIAVDPSALAQAQSLDASTAPRGSLFGLPVLIKDNVETQGPLPTTAGSLALTRNVTGRDATVVARLRAAGAVILGKTNLSEWANIRAYGSMWGWSAVGGQTHNPYVLDRSPGGSSAGSAVAVAAGMVDAAIGTETDGSITIPASLNGIVGLKPTVGLVSRRHIVPISHSQDTPGPMAKNVETIARLLVAMAGSDPADPGTKEADAHAVNYVTSLRTDALTGARIGVLRFATGWSAGVDAVFDRSVKLLANQGATLVEIGPLQNLEKLRSAETIVLHAELKSDLNAYLAATPSNVTTRTLRALIVFNSENAERELRLFGQDRFVMADATQGITDSAYIEATKTAIAMARTNGIDALLAKYRLSALVGPTMPPAWKIDAVNGDQFRGEGPGSLAAVAGYPHLTVPMGLVKGLPVGISFIGPPWSEATLLSYGYSFEVASALSMTPTYLPSIETSNGVAPLLRPSKSRSERTRNPPRHYVNGAGALSQQSSSGTPR